MYTGSPESIIVKMAHCWKSHVAALLILFAELVKKCNETFHIKQSTKESRAVSRPGTFGSIQQHPRYQEAVPFSRTFLVNVSCDFYSVSDKVFYRGPKIKYV